MTMYKVYLLNFDIKFTYYDATSMIHYIKVDDNIEKLLMDKVYPLKRSYNNEEFIYNDKVTFVSKIPDNMMFSAGPFIGSIYIELSISDKAKLKIFLKDWIEYEQ